MYNSENTVHAGRSDENGDLFYQDLKNNFGGIDASPDVSIQSSLRKHYRDHVITVSTDCDLLDFAKAGRAEATLIVGDDSFLRTRSYEPAPRGSKGAKGKFKDVVLFGKYLYKWDGDEFLVYVLKVNIQRIQVKRTAILRKRESADVTGKDHSRSTDRLIAAVTQHSRDASKEISVFDNGAWTKSREMWRSVQAASWDDIIAPPEMKRSLVEDIEGFFDSEGAYKSLAVPWKRGIILTGPPGNGKTISIAALVNSLSKRIDPIPALYVKTFTSTNGQEKSIRAIFTLARTTAPCVLIFEDVDSLVEERARSYFLNEIDGLENNDGIMMIGTANHLEKLDPAIAKRPSRFDRKYFFALPAKAERLQYCEYWRTKLRNSSSPVSFPPSLCAAIANITEGFSFAYMKEAFVVSLLSIIYERRTSEPKSVDDGGNVGSVTEGKVHGHIEGAGDDDNNEGAYPKLKDVPLWEAIETQIKVLKAEMGNETVVVR
ncbi:MAG: hypothetical protein M1837_005754 [Sclerophora amabilis]|nr:MAG: hypothetical protein M1837_005754 [Sclerophora amabilis]